MAEQDQQAAERSPTSPANVNLATVNRPLFTFGIAAAIGAAVVAVYVSMHPFIPQDAAVERDVQSVAWGPLAVTFPVYSWIGDAKGFFVELLAFVAILLINRRAWLVAAGAAFSALWYIALSHIVLRPRPTTATVLRVTEHPGASSFPSGHTIFICTLVVVLVVCLGYRFLRGWGRVFAWIAGAAVIAGNVIDRVDTGAHWPSDVLEGL
ncbi:MAG TPA: phosphatase PAP2 family protein, partial [Candidatus Dormibacteraeota bacterium]|nr:phosphatase PAP2 family protein [Candidatus Dormibacteraeota bacterium]